MPFSNYTTYLPLKQIQGKDGRWSHKKKKKKKEMGELATIAKSRMPRMCVKIIKVGTSCSGEATVTK